MSESLLINEPDLTVSQLSAAIKRTLEDRFDHVRVRGELGRVTFHRNGHIYLDLKDEKSVIAGVVWKGQAMRLAVKPQEGLEVIATGRITTYGPQSKYQLVVERLEIAGEGALMALLEKRRRFLAAEGLFAEERKKPLPFLPEVIGVVTSPSGAVIRDILHRLADRFPRRVLIWPVAVQGEKAAMEVAEAIRGFNELTREGCVPRPDLLIVARGGGALEDLWAFNEEVVVRAAAASAIPLVSAVGHETDTTLIDFASDKRAPTPTAAAELAVPVRADILADVLSAERRLVQAMRRHMIERRRHLEGLERGLPRTEDLLAQAIQRFDNWAARLPFALTARTRAAEAILTNLAARLRPRLLVRQLQSHHERVSNLTTRSRAAVQRLPSNHERRLSDLAARLARALDRRLRDERKIQSENGAHLHLAFVRLDKALIQSLRARKLRVDGVARLLKTLSFEGTLERGFVLVQEERGQIVRTAAAALSAQQVCLRFAGGKVVQASTLAIPPAPTQRSKKTKTGRGKQDPQGRLL